jgi:hypothetical protein
VSLSTAICYNNNIKPPETNRCLAKACVGRQQAPAGKVWEEDHMLQSRHSVYLAISSIR